MKSLILKIKVLLAAALVSMAGCGQNFQNNANVSIPYADIQPSTTSFDAEIGMVTSLYGAFGETSGKDGLYTILVTPEDGANILYTDYNTNTMTYLCASPECSHNSDACTSWFDCFGGSLFMNRDQSYLFYVSSEQKEKEQRQSLWRMELDGSKRTKLFECAANEQIVDAVASDATNLYFAVRSIDQNADSAKTLISLNIENGQQKELLSYGDGDWLFGAFDDNLLILSFDGSTFEYKQYSLSDHTETSIYSYTYNTDDPTMSAIARPNGDTLYILEPTEEDKAQIVKWNVTTQEQTMLVQDFPYTGADNTFVAGFYDGYMCVDVTDTQNPKEIESFRYFVNCETGEVKESTLQYTRGALSEFVSILGETETTYLVQIGSSFQDFMITSNDGTMYQAEYEIPKYAQISKRDYFNNLENYKQCTSLW